MLMVGIVVENNNDNVDVLPASVALDAVVSVIFLLLFMLSLCGQLCNCYMPYISALLTLNP